jgi:hypothetical protein
MLTIIWVPILVEAGPTKSVSELIDRLDEVYVDTYVDLDGGWAEDILDARLRKFKEAAPERFNFLVGPAGSIGKLKVIDLEKMPRNVLRRKWREARRA